MSGMKSKNKGRIGEREIINLLQPIVDEQYKLYSSLQIPLLERNLNQSNKGGYDIIGLDWIALEIKRQETLQLKQWWAQTIQQAKIYQKPVLLFRQSNKPWQVLIEATIGHGVFIPAQISIDSFLEWFKLKLKDELTNNVPLPPRSTI